MELERVVLENRAVELRREARKQARQRAFLREERKKAREEKDLIEKDKAALKHLKKRDWWPGAYFPKSNKRLRVNVGGQIFEISEDFVNQDPESLLAALTSADSPFGNGEIPHVDRDWWVFRYVLIFLRDGVLPTSRQLVVELYREAAFWRLVTLQRAIEETHLNLTRAKIEVDIDPASKTYGTLKETTATRKSKFWLNKPNWWEAQPPKVVEKSKAPKPDWWTSTDDWRGTRYGPLSTDPLKVVATKDDVKNQDHVYPMTAATWGYYA
ncbi:hypothetical protein CTAYLR_007197 [Chrysophaeum taylorii]|uniref:BTB domain-containing protein n=1 Tax=Chrysophaeum taylorii TaxID=2483200 RepID=A0AAD7UN31_9STRA|nr:hypothetical protein CTAYLR_007197 [Chrysophaeum taylorii]